MSKKFIIPVSIILLIAGVFIGMKIQNAVSDDKISSQVRKFNDAFEVTSRYYVDDVDSQKLTEDAIKGMLDGLDPHSVYISAEQLKRVNEDFQGSFDGIGVEFDIVNDTLTIVSPISGGPSEKLGILAGDKIVKIDGKSSVKIARDDVPKKLKLIVTSFNGGYMGYVTDCRRYKLNTYETRTMGWFGDNNGDYLTEITNQLVLRTRCRECFEDSLVEK